MSAAAPGQSQLFLDLVNIVIIIIVLGVTAMVYADSNTVPQPDFFAASMANQMQIAAIKVAYKYYPGWDGKTLTNYSRSANAQYLGANVENELPFWSWFDRKANISRSQEPTRSGGRECKVSNRVSPALSSSNLPDPVLYNLPAGYLPDLIGLGSVSNKSEQIDGHDCWRVCITPKDDPSDSYNVWVDPTINCLPRKIVVMQPSGSVPVSTTTFSDYMEIESKIWYPMHIHWEIVIDNNETQTTDIEVMSVEIIDSARVDMQPRFSSGLHVNDSIIDAEYDAP